MSIAAKCTCGDNIYWCNGKGNCTNLIKTSDMTELNKELPKELVENITQEMSNDYGAHIQEGGKPYSLSEHIKDRLDEEYLHYMEYYAPIIEAKDKEIEILKLDAKIIAHKDKQLSEKDKRIAELEARNINLNLINASQDIQILQFKQELKKVMRLLKWEINIKTTATLTEDECCVASIYEKKDWEDYCKENGIDLGGE